MTQSDWRDGAIHGIAWVALTVGVQLAMAGSPSSDAYGVLCAWWANLYLACLLRTRWRAVPVFLAIMAIAVVVDTISGSQRLYHDAPTVSSAEFLVLLLLLCLLWASPFAINAAATRIRVRLQG